MTTDDASRCPMLREALDPSDAVTPLLGARRVDVCIVGGGYLGLWTALELRRAEPQLRIAVLEADVCGGGASGRNSGMALPYWTKIDALVACCGTEGAVRLGDASVRALDEIAVFAEEHHIDIEFQRAGWLWGATSPAQDGRWRGVMATLARLGREPFNELDRAGVQSLLEAPGIGCGAHDPVPATIHPGKLARGLRRVALAQGIDIFEHTPMRRLERGRPAKLVTPRGTVTAQSVVLAMNAWSLAVPELRSGILVITSDDGVSAPAPEFMRGHRWSTGPIVTDSSTFVSGFRPARDGRVVGGVTGGKVGFGSLSGQRFEGRTPREGDIDAALSAFFGVGHGLSMASSWRGPIDRTRSGLPRYGRLPGGSPLWFGYGFSGNGIVGCRLGGRILASLTLGRQDEWAQCGLVGVPERWLPPEPIRYAGAHLVRWAVRQKDRLDRTGQRQGPLGRALAELAPGGVVTTRGS